jgi:hypothetical protein
VAYFQKRFEEATKPLIAKKYNTKSHNETLVCSIREIERDRGLAYNTLSITPNKNKSFIKKALQRSKTT